MAPMRDDEDRPFTATTARAIANWLRTRTGAGIKRHGVLALASASVVAADEADQMVKRLELAEHTIGFLEGMIRDARDRTVPGSRESDELARTLGVIEDYRRHEADCRSRLLVSVATGVKVLSGARVDVVPDVMPAGVVSLGDWKEEKR